MTTRNDESVELNRPLSVNDNKSCPDFRSQGQAITTFGYLSRRVDG